MSNRFFTGVSLLVVMLALAVVRPGVAHGAAEASGVPPLIEAARLQDSDAVSILIREGAAVDSRQADGSTALHWSVYRDDASMVEVLLLAGADVNIVNRLGASPLWLAAANGSADLIGRLLEAGANPNATLHAGETPLMAAARAGTVGGVRLLVAAGAALEAREQTREQTALMWAVAQGHHAVAKVLLAAGADVMARSKVRPRLVYADGTNGGVFDQGLVEQLGGFTPLLFAARHGDVESARVLLAGGASINDPAPNGASPLVVAMHSGHTRLVEFLLERGADPNAGGAGYTPLYAAVLRGDLDATRALLARGADPNTRLERGTPVRRASQDWTLRPEYVSATPFWLAAVYREPAIMRLLAEFGADPLLTTTEAWLSVRERAGGVGPPQLVGGYVTPVMAAVRGASGRGRRFTVADPDPEAEERLALEAVTVAAELGVDVNAADETGTTALHGAASRNLVSIVRFLGARGAALDVKNREGRTPLDLATAASQRGRGVTGLGVDWSSPTAVDVLRELGATEPDGSDRRRYTGRSDYTLDRPICLGGLRRADSDD